MIQKVICIDKLNLQYADDQTKYRATELKEAIKKITKEAKVTLDTYPSKPIKNDTLFISLGGDGTALFAMREAAKCNGQVMAVNLGNLGFLASYSMISYEQYYIFLEDLEDILLGARNRVWLEKRQLLNAGVDIEKEYDKNHFLVTNEYHIAPELTGVMLEAKITIDGKVVGNQSGDGILISTPTGSTAYGLSAGGAILHPSLKALQIAFIAPHSINTRPFIVPQESEVQIEVNPRDKTRIVIRGDGQVLDNLPANKFTLTTGGEKYPTTAVTLWHNKKWSYYSNLAEKMGWWSEEDAEW